MLKKFFCFFILILNLNAGIILNNNKICNNNNKTFCIPYTKIYKYNDVLIIINKIDLKKIMNKKYRILLKNFKKNFEKNFYSTKNSINKNFCNYIINNNKDIIFILDYSYFTKIYNLTYKKCKSM